MRDASIVGLALVLLAIAALATGVGPVAVPTAAALLVAYAAFHLVVVLPSLRARATTRAFASLAVAAPFACALEFASPAGLAWPFAPLAVAAIGSLLASRAGTRVRTVVGLLFALTFACAPLVEGLSLGAVPDALRLPTSALASRAAPATTAAPARHDAAPGVELVRAGALLPSATATALGVDRRVVAAAWTNAPAGVPGGVPAGAVSVRVVGAPSARRTEGRFVLVSAPDVPRDARDLDACDVVLLLDALGRDPAAARTLESFARRGGLLAGPSAPASFGPELDRALGTALPDEDGPRGVRTLGAGHVARVAHAGGLEDLAAAGFVEPAYSTVFDRAVSVPDALRESGDPATVPEPRVPARSLALLAGFAAAVVVASRPGGIRGLVATGALAAVALLGLGLLAPPAEEATGEGFVLDLGGPLGRRVEMLRVRAGPAGWRWTESSTSADGVRVLGLASAGAGGAESLVLEPGHVAWIVTETPSRGDTGGLAPASTVPEWSIPLLRRGGGRPAPARLFVGEGGFQGLVPGGVRGPTSAKVLVVLPGRP